MNESSDVDENPVDEHVDGGVVLSHTTVDKEPHELKTLLDIDVTVVGIVIVENTQDPKAYSPIDDNDEGNVIDVNAPHE